MAFQSRALLLRPSKSRYIMEKPCYLQISVEKLSKYLLKKHSMMLYNTIL